MKNYRIVLIFILSFLSIEHCHSQKLSDIVSLDGYSSNVLFDNAREYILAGKSKKASRSVILDRDLNQIVSPEELLVYSTGIAKHPLGLLRYDYVIDIKNNKYRYTFDSVVYIPYKRNRYGKFVQVRGKKFVLESIINNPKFRFRKDILEYFNQFLQTEAAELNHIMKALKAQTIRRCRKE